MMTIDRSWLVVVPALRLGIVLTALVSFVACWTAHEGGIDLRLVVVLRTAAELNDDDRRLLGCGGSCVDFTLRSKNVVRRMVGSSRPQATVSLSEVKLARVLHLRTPLTPHSIEHQYLLRLELEKSAVQRLTQFKDVPNGLTGLNLVAFAHGEALASARISGSTLEFELVRSKFTPEEFGQWLGFRPEQVRLTTQAVPSQEQPL